MNGAAPSADLRVACGRFLWAQATLWAAALLCHVALKALFTPVPAGHAVVVCGIISAAYFALTLLSEWHLASTNPARLLTGKPVPTASIALYLFSVFLRRADHPFA